MVRGARGQLLAELDDAGLQDQLKTQKITLDQARAAWVSAEENHKIVVSQNESDLKTAEINVMLADLNLQKYTGDGVLEPATGVTAIGLSVGPTSPLMVAAFLTGGSTGKGEYRQAAGRCQRSDQAGGVRPEMAIDRLAWWSGWSEGLPDGHAGPGRSLQTGKHARAAKKVQMELYVLQNFTAAAPRRPQAKLAEANRSGSRPEAGRGEVTADADRQAKLSIYQQEELKFRDVEEEMQVYLVAPGWHGGLLRPRAEPRRLRLPAVHHRPG
jgi:hypothetical protein